MRPMLLMKVVIGLVIAATLLSPVAALAGGAPNYDFTWATIDHPNNPAYSGPDINGQTTGRGSVAYTYRMSTLEVTTAQWMEFANVMATLSEPFRIGDDPIAGYERNFFGSGPRYVLRSFPGAAMYPVSGTTWYNAARYCNWLHNGKQASLASLVRVRQRISATSSVS